MENVATITIWTAIEKRMRIHRRAWGRVRRPLPASSYGCENQVPWFGSGVAPIMKALASSQIER
jgi:hypothetical protein